MMCGIDIPAVTNVAAWYRAVRPLGCRNRYAANGISRIAYDAHT